MAVGPGEASVAENEGREVGGGCVGADMAKMRFPRPSVEMGGGRVGGKAVVVAMNNRSKRK